ncbi:hypothetical protein EVAR_35224_1 [Eumeta japonica]|uniref:Uncharacterized protein n=1 Tax=Eumeta variegata TaxID=151549 RepID=A0A4C1VDM8_EUMVA|nr:hypothetical protein EVAR_35224_1 [Eumeta japonica]
MELKLQVKLCEIYGIIFVAVRSNLRIELASIAYWLSPTASPVRTWCISLLRARPRRSRGQIMTPIPISVLPSVQFRSNYPRGALYLTPQNTRNAAKLFYYQSISPRSWFRIRSRSRLQSRIDIELDLSLNIAVTDKRSM